VDAGYSTDLDGNARKVGSATDMGAYEYQGSGGTTPTPPPTTTPGTVTSLNDGSVGTAVGQFSFNGSWLSSTGSGKYLSQDHYANAAGSSYTVRFSGTQAKLYVATAPWHGKAGVSLDGGPETTIDLYSATKADQVPLYTSPTVTQGTHTLTVRNLGTKNASSTGTYVTADRVDVTS
jgi:hypothetical protein